MVKIPSKLKQNATNQTLQNIPAKNYLVINSLMRGNNNLGKALKA